MKTLVLYLILVCLPILGVSLVLRMGQGLVPPKSIGGAWRVHVTADPACGAISPPDSLAMTVSQSGPRITVALEDGHNTQLSGKVLGREFTVSGSGPLLLHGSFNREVIPNTVTGVFIGVPCAAARSTLIDGTRMEASKETGNQ